MNLPLFGSDPNPQPIRVDQVTVGTDLVVDFGDGLRCFRVTKREILATTDESGNETLTYILHSGRHMMGVPEGEMMKKVGPHGPPI